MRYLKLTYFTVICFLFSITGFAGKPLGTVKYDSVIVKTLKPPRALEQKVFKEVELSFAKVEENKDPGIFERFWSWLLNLIFGKTDHSSRVALGNVFIWAFVLLGLGLAIWLFSRSEFSTFLKGNTKNAEFNFSDLDEDFSGIDFNKKVEQAKSENDYRLAIRWWYLKQLFLLNEKNMIAWQPYKTNMDYLNELHKSNHRQAFKDISKVYEYVWYGKYTVDQTNFNMLEPQFKQFESSISV